MALSCQEVIKLDITLNKVLVSQMLLMLTDLISIPNVQFYCKFLIVTQIFKEGRNRN